MIVELARDTYTSFSWEMPKQCVFDRERVSVLLNPKCRCLDRNLGSKNMDFISVNAGHWIFHARRGRSLCNLAQAFFFGGRVSNAAGCARGTGHSTANFPIRSCRHVDFASRPHKQHCCDVSSQCECNPANVEFHWPARPSVRVN